MGNIPLFVNARLPEEARFIALCLYAGLMRFPNASDEGLAKVFFRVSHGSFYEALYRLVKRVDTVPPAMVKTILSDEGQRYASELLRFLTETLPLASYSSDGTSIRLMITEEIGYELVDHLGITNDEQFEYVRDLGKELIKELPFSRP